MISEGGRIITFYSYKGGTGRSMALANVAWVLAASGKRVLMIDWDLEAPGLHRYFRPFLIDEYLTSSEGLIDFVTRFADAVIRPQEATPTDDWFLEYADITDYALSINFSGFPTPGRIDLVPAGRQGSSYATRVSVFDWQNFYDRLGGGAFLEAARNRMRQEYDYVLIDSRTGVSDTAGICTVQMPDSLAVCFTYNNQSIEGAAGVAHSARSARRQLGNKTDSVAIEVFPIPTRVDQSETDMLQARQLYARTQFEDFITTKRNRESYWTDVEIPYIAFYSYEEILAPFREEPSDKRGVLGAIVRITDQITGAQVSDFQFPISPEDKAKIRLAFAATPVTKDATRSTTPSESPLQVKVRQAETAFLHLAPELQLEARRVLSRLVRVARSEDGGNVKQQVKVSELGQSEVVKALASAGVISIPPQASSSEEMAEISDAALIRQWDRLRNWLEEDFAFLHWRQRLREQVMEWTAHSRKSDFLLRSERLREAQKWLGEHHDDLNDSEKEFISRSSEAEYKASAQPVTTARRACILRPFGTKSGIDFDKIEQQLIGPALEQLGVQGRLTLDIVESGNIRSDMFRQLLTASLVIVDVSIPAANVYYELGIRHALRDRGTFMLRSTTDAFPFDLQSDRHFVYDKDVPARRLEELVKALKLKLESDQVDSPVFMTLPDLREPDASKLISVPADFREDVDRATADKRPGDLALLSQEVRGFDWEIKGLRIIAKAEFDLKSLSGARDTLEAIRRIDPQDLEANLLLGTVYERLGDLVSSTQALERALTREDLGKHDRAEAYALLARNSKTRWRDTWRKSSRETWRAQALLSTYLEDSFKAYLNAFNEDVSHSYSGLNALSLLTIMIELGKELPDVWQERFETDREADNALERLKEQAGKLASAVEFSLETGARAELTVWIRVSRADLLFLTTQRPNRVAAAYSDALSGAPEFVTSAVRRQLSVFEDLDLLRANREAVTKVTGILVETDEFVQSPSKQRVLLFTGHMIDAPDRPNPRFPADKESIAREEIKRSIEREMKEGPGGCIGIASGASGGDLLFHEVCTELGIPTELYLTLVPELFVKTSVEKAGPQWVQRFWEVHNKHVSQRRAHVLSGDSGIQELPAWLRPKPNYNIWQRSNLWMLHNALITGGSDAVTLIALWDGEMGDGLGGTSSLVEAVQQAGGRYQVIDTKSLFGLRQRQQLS